MKIPTDALATAAAEMFGEAVAAAIDANAGSLGASLCPALFAGYAPSLAYFVLTRVDVEDGQGPAATLTPRDALEHATIAPWICPTFGGAVERPILTAASATGLLAGTPVFEPVVVARNESGAEWAQSRLRFDATLVTCTFGVMPAVSRYVDSRMVNGQVLYELGHRLRPAASSLALYSDPAAGEVTAAFHRPVAASGETVH